MCKYWHDWDETKFVTHCGESTKVPAQVWNSVGDLLMATDFSIELGNIKVPALILWGDRDGLCNWNGQQQLTERLSNSRLQSIGKKAIVL